MRRTEAALAGGWAFGGSAPSAAELGELYLNTDLLGRREALQLSAAEDLAALHARAATRAPARTEVTYTRLDTGGRLPVPLCPGRRAPARGTRRRRAGDVPARHARGTPPRLRDAPAAGRPRGRLLLGPRLRDLLGLPSGATVITRADPDRGVLELMAASRVEPHLDEVFDAHRRGAEEPSGSSAADG